LDSRQPGSPPAEPNVNLSDVDDSHIPAPQVGATLKRLRQDKKLSLNELAKLSGVSIGQLSQIEREKANPSLKTLTRIRLALGVPLSALFDGQSAQYNDPKFVRRVNLRPVLSVGGPQALVKTLLSPSVAHNLQFMFIDVPPHGNSGALAMTYPSEKGGLLMSGELNLDVGDESIVLHPGDSFQFDGGMAHGFRNTTDFMAQVLWFVVQTTEQRHL